MDTFSNIEEWDATKLSLPRKIYIVLMGLFCTFNCSLGTSLPSGDVLRISEYFDVTDRVRLSLLNSMTMIGFVLGPLLWGPLSEYVGRKPVLLSSYTFYVTFTLVCSSSPTYGALLGFRLLCGVSAAAPTTVISGLYADILDDPSQRGLAIALFMTSNTSGALVAPTISGFASYLSWRWPFWVAGIIASPGIFLLLLIPETYAPVLLHRTARGRQRNESDEPTGENGDFGSVFNIRKIFLRPMTLMLSEPVLILSSVYLATVYAILYLMFQAYPMIFEDLYHLSAGTAGLAYLPILFGVFVGLLVSFGYIKWHGKCQRSGKAWAQREVNRRLPIAILASPCMTVSLFWLGWSSWESASPAIPAFAGVFFGIGFQILFMAMLNYITDFFLQFAASAHAGASCLRSIFAVLVPLAAGPMYDRLGFHWAPSLLGFLTLLLGLIPFFFIRYNDLLSRKTNITVRPMQSGGVSQ